MSFSYTDIFNGANSDFKTSINSLEEFQKYNTYTESKDDDGNSILAPDKVRSFNVLTDPIEILPPFLTKRKHEIQDIIEIVQSNKGQKKYYLADCLDPITVPILTKSKLMLLVACSDIPSANVKAGDIGGFIEGHNNLDEYGESWVHFPSIVCGRARVQDSAKVCGPFSIVSGASLIKGNSVVIRSYVSVRNRLICDNGYIINSFIKGASIIELNKSALVSSFINSKFKIELKNSIVNNSFNCYEKDFIEDSGFKIFNCNQEGSYNGSYGLNVATKKLRSGECRTTKKIAKTYNGIDMGRYKIEDI